MSTVDGTPDRASEQSPGHAIVYARSQTSTDIADWLTNKVAAYLALDPDRIDHARPLAEYGLDSVYALTLCGEIEDLLGVAVEPTMAWDYPTVAAMAGYLLSQLEERS